MAFFVHASNPVKSLPKEDLARIYSGKVANWKEVGGPDQPIKAFALSPVNGARMAVNDVLLSKESMAARVTTRGTPKDVLALLAATPGGIAFLGEAPPRRQPGASGGRRAPGRLLGLPGDARRTGPHPEEAGRRTPGGLGRRNRGCEIGPLPDLRRRRMRTHFRRMIRSRALSVAAVLAVLGSQSPVLAATPGELRKRSLEVVSPIPDKMPGSENDTPVRVALGRSLFFEKNISANGTQSCNSCHAVDDRRGGVDNEPTSPGAFGKRGGRNSPTVLNAGFHIAQFWDGRAATLEDQAKGPVLNPGEMAMPSEAEVLKRLGTSHKYQKAFKEAFPGEEKPITYDNFAKAVAAFERTLRTQDRFDDFLKGDDKALTAAELKGLDTFLTVGCTTCHNGPLLGGNGYKKLGVLNEYADKSDKGRIEVTKEEYDEFVFKVPSLRNIAITAPYFHNGSQKTLEEAVKSMAWLQLGKELKPEEVGDIAAFLKALTDKPRAVAKK